MKYRQTREILFSTLNTPTRDLVMSAQWPSNFALTHVLNIIDSFTGDRDASDYDCLIVNHEVEIVRDIRMMGITTPILNLVSENNASVRVTALQAGADDCMGPVFSVSELVARADALCRRTNGGNLRVQERDSALSVSDKTLEALILRLFLENQNRLISSNQLSRHVWGEGLETSNNLVCVHLGNLRRKMNSIDWVNRIRTIRGRGYILAAEAD
jgi:DNA-binding response OmpR family regulator